MYLELCLSVVTDCSTQGKALITAVNWVRSMRSACNALLPGLNRYGKSPRVGGILTIWALGQGGSQSSALHFP